MWSTLCRWSDPSSNNVYAIVHCAMCSKQDKKEPSFGTGQCQYIYLGIGAGKGEALTPKSEFNIETDHKKKRRLRINNNSALIN